MKKLLNPYEKLDGYNCFGCSNNNISGLHMKFYENGDEIYSQWQPIQDFAGFKNILHGGIQATIMDEIASWVVTVKTGTSGVTSELTTKFLKPVRIVEDNPISIKAKLVKRDDKKAYINAKIYNFEDELCSESNVVYYLYPEEVARRKLFYPGRDAYFES